MGVLAYLGDPDLGLMASTYLGYWLLGAAAVDAGAAGAAEALAESAVSEYQQLQTEFLDVFGVDFDFGQSSVVPSEAGGAEPGATPRPGREEYEVMAQRYMDEGDEGRAEEIRRLARERFGEKESEQPPGRSARKEPRRTPPPAPSSSDD